MPKIKSEPQFKLGDKVRVRSGISDPDYDDLTIGGWAGTVSKVQIEMPPTYLVRWTKETLCEQSSIYRRRCERDGFGNYEMWLAEDDLESDVSSPLVIERPTNVVTKSLSLNDQDDRVRAAFDLTSDDPLPEVDDESLAVYYQYLAHKLAFPFEAEYSFEVAPFQSTTFSITVLGLLDLDDFPIDEYGLVCRARRGAKRIELPLTKVETSRDNPNRQTVEDYSRWFAN